MRSPATLAAVVLCISLAACRVPPPPPKVAAVQITVVPTAGGMAEFAVNRDGSIKGGHLSGGPRPFVHEDNGKLDSATTKPFWELVTQLQDSLPAQVESTGKGYVQIQLNYEGGTSWLYAWADNVKAPDRRVRAVADWMFAHRIGGW